MMDINKVLSLLPHRYPFLLIDRVLEYEKDTRLLALKNVTYNEPFFNGHFPIRPVMPGVLIIEAMAQAAGVTARSAVSLVRVTDSASSGPNVFWVSLNTLREDLPPART